MTGDGGTPAVTAVFVAHRSDDRLARAVRSVAEQSSRPREIVVFGNGVPIEPPELPDGAGIRVVAGSSDSNLGVAGGRNAASALATGEFLLFVDDDAILHPGALQRALATMEDPRVGAVAFNVVDPITGAPALWYHPFDRAEWSRRRFESYSVIGCGNLVRKDAFEELGGFWDGYFREAEEFDFSWRLIDSGRTIVYEPEAVVEHPERSNPHFRYSAGSNLIMVARLMPVRAALRQAAFLLALFGVRAVRHGKIRDFARALRDVAVRLPRAVRERETLRPETVAYLRRVHAAQGLGKRLRWSLRPLAPPPPFGGQPADAG